MEIQGMNDLDTFVCNKCNYSTNKPSFWIKHTSTKKHQKKVLLPENTLPVKKEYYCECCKITVYHLTNWNIHINSFKHKREGKPKSMFNAHRIYSYEQVLSYFPNLSLKEFTLIPENNGNMISLATEEQADKEHYGCGCFWFTKPAN